MKKMSKNALMSPAHVLAAQLAQWGTDANLLKTAAAYMKDYPEADLFDWLDRLVSLGDLFSSSQQTDRYRQQLQAACQQINETYKIQSGDDWAWVLGWAARLTPYYDENKAKARRIAPEGQFRYRQVQTFRRQRSQTPSGSIDDLPAVRDEVSEEAEDLFNKLQSLWGNREEEE